MISNNILLNISVDASLLGSANGLALGFSAMMRAIGPASAGLIFGWTTNNGLGFPFNFFLPFIYSAVLCLLSWCYLRARL
jgi:sugar phosphate permease